MVWAWQAAGFLLLLLRSIVKTFQQKEYINE